MTEPLELPYQRALEIFRRGHLGRVAVSTHAGPRIFAVGYVTDEDSCVFAIPPYGVLGAHAWNAQLALETDEVDPVTCQGWSVVATGHGRLLEDPAEIARWWPPLGGHGQHRDARLLHVRMRLEQLSGRMLAPAPARP